MPYTTREEIEAATVDLRDAVRTYVPTRAPGWVWASYVLWFPSDSVIDFTITIRRLLDGLTHTGSGTSAVPITNQRARRLLDDILDTRPLI